MAVTTAIILAAGMGVRLGDETRDIPKCLLSVGGRTILEGQLACLERHGIKETAVVVGYLKDAISDRIGRQFGEMTVSYVENPIYDRTNNGYSLWLASGYLKEGCLLLEGDICFDEAIVAGLLASPSDSLAVVASFEAGMDGSVVRLGAGNVIESIVLKGDQNTDFDYQDVFKTVNIYRLSARMARLLAVRLNAGVGRAEVNEFYELALRDIVADGAATLHGMPTSGLPWCEIDTANDLAAARRIFGHLGPRGQ